MSVYVPPATSTGAACSGGCGTENDAKYSYLSGYFNAHMLSMPSHRYAYIAWIVVCLVVLIVAACSHLGVGDQSYIGSAWKRWALKDRVIKFGKKERLQDPNKPAKRRKVITFTSFGRLLLLIALIVVPVVLTLIGADYIRPSANVFNMKESWPSSNISPYTPGLNRRLEWGQGQYPRVLTNPPSITLPYRTWWTAGGRTGAMTNALTPFIVVVALKQIPFALLSTKLLGGYAFDRLSFMHKWGGRVVWLFATAHVVLWSVQLAQDTAFNQSMWSFVFMWTRFRWGFVSYGFFTLLVLLSVGPIRARFYEFFYVTHVVCVIGFMVSAWLHHPPLGAWMYATLLWWLLERIVRVIKVAYVNGLGFGGRRSQVVVSSPSHYNVKRPNHTAGQQSYSAASSQTMHSDSMNFAKPYTSPKPSFNASLAGQSPYANGGQPYSQYDSPADRRMTRTSARYDAVNDVIEDYAEPSHESTSIPLQSMGTPHYALQDNGPVQAGQYPASVSDGSTLHPGSYHTSADHYGLAASIVKAPAPRPAMAADVAAILRPGYAYAQLLPGKTLRLTLRTPNSFAWRPGQYVNLNVPKVRWWQSHPFTIASAYNADFPSSTAFKEAGQDLEKGLATSRSRGGEERTMVLLLRARKGFTHALWDYVRIEREKQIRQIEESTGVRYAHGEVAKTATGVHLRAIVDGPFGSAQRTRWGMHSSVVIVCGGSGISYGMAALEYLCAVMAGIKRESKFQTRRIRFVWILREYSHLQWVASALRRCVELVPPEMLQVDLYVTSTHAVRRQARPAHQHANHSHDFASSYDTATLGGQSYDDGASMYQARFTEGPDQEEYEINAYDLTQFDGEDTSAPTAAEAKINERVQKEGKLRRAHTRRATIKRNKRRAEALKEGKGRQDQQESVSNDDAIVRAAQRGIHDRAVRQTGDLQPNRREARYPPPSPMPIASHEQHDLGQQSIDERDGMYGNDEYDERLSHRNFSKPQVQLHPASPQQIDGTSNGYFASASSFQGQTSAGASPLGSPRLTPAHSFGGRYTPDPLGSTHSLPFNPASSTTHLNTSYAHPPRSALGRHFDGNGTPDYQDGETLQPTPSATDVPIDLDEDENADLNVVAELARPGYPKLDRIIREEIGQSVGRVLVASCGPTSLGRLIRSIVSKQIDLKAIRSGRPNAQINVATESYEWGG